MCLTYLFSFSDDSLGYEFPFILKAVGSTGIQCAWCPWYEFCRGCRIQCNDTEFKMSSSYLAVDWDPTALHLRYQTSQERVRFMLYLYQCRQIIFKFLISYHCHTFSSGFQRASICCPNQTTAIKPNRVRLLPGSIYQRRAPR